MKKIMGIVLAGCLAVSLTACGKAPAGNSGADTKVQDTKAAGQTDSGASVQERERVIQLGHIDPATNDPYQLLAEEFADQVSKLSGGRIQIDILSDAQLGSEASMIEGMKLGTIDCAIISNFSYSSHIPEFCTFDMPYLFLNEEQARQVMDDPEITGDLVDRLYEEYDVKILAYGEGGFRSVIDTVKPIHTPDDLAGIKIRVPGNETYLATFSALKANPVSMASSECYTGLQQGTIDGLEQPIGPMYSYKSYEVCSYISLTEHLYNPISLTVSRSLWESLDQEAQGWLQEAARYARDTQRGQMDAFNQKLLQAMTDEKGVAVNEVEDKAAFRQAVQPVYDDYITKFGPERLDKIQARIETLN